MLLIAAGTGSGRSLRMGIQPLNLEREVFGPLAFGGGALGNLYVPIPDDSARDAIHRAVDAGIRYFDTAPHYGFGLSEQRLGATLRELDPAERLIVSTKVGRKLVPRAGIDLTRPRQGFVSPEPYESEFDYSYESVLRTFESSLRRLQRTRIDMLYVHDIGAFTHGPDHPRRFGEFMQGGYEAMQRLRSTRAVSAIGIGVNETQVATEALRCADFDVVLLAGRYTLLEQGALDSFLPLAARRGVKVIIGAPFNSGILATGVRSQSQKYNYETAPPEVIARVASIEAVCERHGVPLAAAALQFPLAHPQVVSVLAGMGTASQVATALDNINWPLPRQLWADLRVQGLIRPDAPVPNDEAARR
jgi:D-threo-aldose 1-dehydrogenase